jgi:hypothetical protein
MASRRLDNVAGRHDSSLNAGIMTLITISCTAVCDPDICDNSLFRRQALSAFRRSINLDQSTSSETNRHCYNRLVRRSASLSGGRPGALAAWLQGYDCEHATLPPTSGRAWARVSSHASRLEPDRSSIDRNL